MNTFVAPSAVYVCVGVCEGARAAREKLCNQRERARVRSLARAVTRCAMKNFIKFCVRVHHKLRMNNKFCNSLCETAEYKTAQSRTTIAAASRVKAESEGVVINGDFPTLF